MSEWIDTDKAAEYLSVSTKYLIRLRMNGGGPRFARLAGGRLIRYKITWLDAWIEAHAHQATCEYAGSTPGL